MKGLSRLCGTGVALLLLVGSTARADFVSWTYQGSGTPTLTAGNASTTGVNFVYDPLTSVVGNSAIAVANLWTFSQTQPPGADTFTNAGYTLALNLTDGSSGKSGTVSFQGLLNGTVSTRSALLTNTFLGSTVKSVVLGANVYTVALGNYAPPGPPTASNAGSISAQITVQPSLVPEPPALVLAALGLGGLGFVSWRRWQAARLGLV
jgi:hypothetical protein